MGNKQKILWAEQGIMSFHPPEGRSGKAGLGSISYHEVDQSGDCF
jgi:hypothetical protein